MRLISTPPQITDILYQGQLEPEEPGGLTKSNAIVLEEEELPTVEIGIPQCLNIEKLYKEEGKTLPATIRLLLNEADFFIVHLGCTFNLDQASHNSITWARFIVDLRPQNAGSPLPIAFDLHPLRVEEKKQRDIHITLSPSLKFTLLEASLESVVDLHYTELIPVIIAGGILKNRFSWELHAIDQHSLCGSHWFHAVVKSPRQAGGVLATFHLRAQVLTPRGRGVGVLGQSKSDSRDNLSSVICV